MTNPLIPKTIALKTWAVVGATDDPAKFGYRIFRVLKDRGYTVLPINPKLSDIDGVPCHASLKDLPMIPDVVDMVVNPYVGINVMKEIAELGIKHVWLQPGTRSDSIREFAAANGINLIEDCILVRIDQEFQA